MTEVANLLFIPLPAHLIVHGNEVAKISIFFPCVCHHESWRNEQLELPQEYQKHMGTLGSKWNDQWLLQRFITSEKIEEITEWVKDIPGIFFQDFLYPYLRVLQKTLYVKRGHKIVKNLKFGVRELRYEFQF